MHNSAGVAFWLSTLPLTAACCTLPHRPAVTRADVEVQPYAFTTKSLYVGHTDYKYLRWQVGTNLCFVLVRCPNILAAWHVGRATASTCADTGECHAATGLLPGCMRRGGVVRFRAAVCS